MSLMMREFERHFGSLAGHPSLERRGGKYLDVRTQHDWADWQAAWAAALRSVAPKGSKA